MPPKSQSKSNFLKNQLIGEFSKNTKLINNMEQKIEEQKELLLVRQRELNSISIDNEKNEKLLKKLQRKRKLLSDSIEKQRQSIYYKKRKLVNLNETLTV